MKTLIPSSVVARIVVLCLLLIAVAVTAVAGLAYSYFRSDIMATALDDTRGSVRTMGLLYEAAVPSTTASLRDGNLDKVVSGGETVKTHDLVDRTAGAIGGVATVFEKQGSDYVRISTNVKNEQGERAIGTKLAAEVIRLKSR